MLMRRWARLIAWIIGWDLILEYALGAVTVAIGWSGYVVSFLKNIGIVVPQAFAGSPFSYDAADRVWHTTGAIINVPAMLVIAGISVLLVVGIRESARANGVMVIIKLVIILVFIAAAAPFVNVGHWMTAGNPDGAFIPPNTGPGQFGLSGVLRGAAVVFFAYIGFDAVSTAAQEATNPKRDMPIGILGSLGICTILYVVVGFVLTGIVSYDKLNVPDPIAVGIDAVGPVVAFADPQIRHHPRPDLGHPGDAVGSVARVLFDGPRRSVAARRQQGAQPVPYALCHDADDRGRGHGAGGPPADRTWSANWSASARCSPSPSSAPACLVLRIKEPAIAAAVPHAGGLHRRAAWHAVVGVSDVWTAVRYLGAVRRLAC